MRPFWKAVLIAAAITAAVLIVTPYKGHAQEPIKFSQVIMDFGGKPFTECMKKTPCAEGEETNVTLGLLLSRLLSPAVKADGDDKQPMGLTLDEQNARAHLALQIYQEKEIVLTPEQITMIKKILPKLQWPNLIVYRICTAIDPTCRPK